MPSELEITRMATRHVVHLPLPVRTKTLTLSPLLLLFPKIHSKTLLSPVFSSFSSASSSMASSASKKGGMPGATSLRDCKVLEQMVKKQAENGKICAAICAAPSVALGSWGLLKGLQATCYPSFMEKLPSDATKVECRVHVDGNVVTSRGARDCLGVLVGVDRTAFWQGES